jgi:hypothetical protein
MSSFDNNFHRAQRSYDQQSPSEGIDISCPKCCGDGCKECDYTGETNISEHEYRRLMRLQEFQNDVMKEEEEDNE